MHERRACARAKALSPAAAVLQAAMVEAGWPYGARVLTRAPAVRCAALRCRYLERVKERVERDKERAEEDPTSAPDMTIEPFASEVRARSAQRIAQRAAPRRERQSRAMPARMERVGGC